MAREGARATESTPETSPSAGSATARLLGCREGMQGGQNMPWKGSRATDIALILSPSHAFAAAQYLCCRGSLQRGKSMS